MAEFGMKQSQSRDSFHAGGGGAMGGGGGGVDWYSPGAGSYTTTTSYAPGPAAASGGYHAQPQGSYMPVSTPAYGTGDPSTNFADEPPLLEELGIDLGGILSKTRAILLHRLNNKATEDLDMGGALLFVLLLGGLHLLTGKLHFGVILGWSVVHSTVLWFLVNQLAGVDAAETKGLELYAMCCVVGYCLAPVAVFSALSLMLPRGLASAVLGVLCTLWAAVTASKILVRRCPALEDSRAIITFPCTLLYAAFTMLALY